MAEGWGGLTQPIVSRPERNGGSPSVLVREAARFLGDSNPTPFHEEWCRDFINFIASKIGIRLANQSHRAIDALWLGPHVRTPRPGDLAVVGHHHVTIFAGWRGRAIIGLGGNQGHRVRYSQYAANRVLAFVRL